METEKIVTAEEAPKNGEATATENGAASVEDKSPATSPAVESKEVVAPAAVAAAAEPAAAVVNGTTEPAKDEKSIAEIKPAVVEEKKAEPAVAAPPAEEPKKIEPVVVAAPVIVAESIPIEALKEKLNIDAVPAKIEVKPDNIQSEDLNDDKAPPKSSNEEVIQQQDNTRNEELKKENDDGDSESAQNLNPPPLPCTSPPSQVSVFALSDSKIPEQQQVVETEQQTLEDLPTPPPSPPAVEAKTEILESVEEILPAVISEVPAVEKTEIAVVESSPPAIEESQAAPVVEEIAAPIVEETKTTVVETKEETEVAQETQIEQKSELVIKPEEKVDETVNVVTEEPATLGVVANQEQIAQTIALIDEVTHEAVISVSNKLEEENSQSNEELPKNESTEIVESEKSTEAVITSQSPPLPDVITESSEIKTDVSESIVDPETNKEQKSDESNATSAAEELAAAVIPAPEEILTEKIENSVENLVAAAIITNESASSEDLTATTTTETTAATKSKENGFGENHTAETSATESLNGHDHKTIEDMKNDCSAISEPKTEMGAAAGTIEVAE